MPGNGQAGANPVDHKPRELGANLGNINVFVALPTRYCIAHAEYGERRHARVKRGSEFAVSDALLDDLLENAFESARPAADTAPALGRQVLALIEEDLDEVGAI